MKKTMIGILAGNGPNSKLYNDDFKTFQINDVQDSYAFYPVKVHPNWKLDSTKFTQIDDGGKIPDHGVVPTIRNRMIRFADQKGYEVLWIVDDDICNFYHFVKPENEEWKRPLKYERKGLLPEVEEAYGGIIGANFKFNKLLTHKKYSHQIPFSCIYLNLKLLKQKLGKLPEFDEDPFLWDDFDFALQMRKLQIVPETFNEYAHIKGGTQDSETLGKSLAASGADKVNRLSYGTYKKWGHNNTLIKLKVNIIDVSPALTTVFRPDGFIKYRYRVDTFEHWKEDVLADAQNLRKSVKAKQVGHVS